MLEQRRRLNIDFNLIDDCLDFNNLTNCFDNHNFEKLKIDCDHNHMFDYFDK